MKTIGLIALIVLCAILVSLAWVRFAPAKADRYHVAPGSEPKPEGRGVQLLGEDAPYFEASPSAVEAALRAVAARKGRVKLVAESENPRRMTYLARTKIVGFPDYMTFEFSPEGAGTRLEVLSRARFAGYDWDVNAKRVEIWTRQIREALGQ